MTTFCWYTADGHHHCGERMVFRNVLTDPRYATTTATSLQGATPYHDVIVDLKPKHITNHKTKKNADSN